MEEMKQQERPTNGEYSKEYDMCPNCVTPYHCKGPHIPRNHWGRVFPDAYNFLYSLLT